MSELRQYVPGEDRFDGDGYPLAWRDIKHDVRAAHGNRCVRCQHPYRGGSGEWSRCDDACLHGGPFRVHQGDREIRDEATSLEVGDVAGGWVVGSLWVDARWRVLTVHHLDGDKANCRWWNLVPLCQRCHLSVQARVVMDRPYDRRHSTWFLPFVAGFYAFKYLDEDLSRVDVEARMEELLLLELRQESLFA